MFVLCSRTKSEAIVDQDNPTLALAREIINAVGRICVVPPAHK